MLWFIIAFVISVIIGILVKKFSFWSGFFTGFVPSLFVTSIIAAIVAFSIGHNMMFEMHDYNREYSKTELYAISDNLNVNGTFFLGSGSVSGTAYYYYIVKDTYGYRTRKVSAEDAFVNFSDGTPNIEIYTFTLKSNLWALSPKGYTIIINIPENSITQTFSIDLH